MVIAGKSKGVKGTIVRTLPARDLVIVDGANIVKRHRKPTQQGQKGQIVEKPMPVHVSNVQILDPKGGKPTRIRISREGGKRTRVATKSGQKIS